MVTRRNVQEGKHSKIGEVKKGFWGCLGSPMGSVGVAQVEKRRGIFWKG